MTNSTVLARRPPQAVADLINDTFPGFTASAWPDEDNKGHFVVKVEWGDNRAVALRFRNVALDKTRYYESDDAPVQGAASALMLYVRQYDAMLTEEEGGPAVNDRALKKVRAKDQGALHTRRGARAQVTAP